MDRTVTVNVRQLATVALLGVALIAAYLVGASGGAVGAPHAATVGSVKTADSITDQRTVDTSGVGTAQAVPDQLGFSIAMSRTELKVNDAFAAANALTKKAVAILTKNGVKAKNIQTSGLSTYPVYSRKRGQPAVFKGYRVSQYLNVSVLGVKQGGTVISRVVAGLGRSVSINGIQLQVSNPEKYLAKARTAAVAAAKAKAQQYAKAAGGSLGQILTVREVANDYYGSSRGSYFYAAGDSAALPASLSIQSGQDDLSISVEVVWALS